VSAHGVPGLAWLIAASCALAGVARAEDTVPLHVEAKIALGAIKGRIDHLAVDLSRRRLFVAELGNDTVGIVDLEAREKRGSITSLHEPQGVAYQASSDTLFVASGGDGTLRLYRGGDLSPVATQKLGEDADNVRIDARTGQVVVGYGHGALAFVDPKERRVVAEARLKGHPESFQLDVDRGRAFVNVPESGHVAVVDLSRHVQTATFPVKAGSANFPMALLQDGRVLVVTRKPPRLIMLDGERGDVVADVPTCGDSDDVFFDAKRGRIYVSCGDGHVDVFASSEQSVLRLARITTADGARTSLFVPDLDRLFVAVRANGTQPAAVWVLKPQE
jgi:DNA-binding beta-propeller fold protein YncE